MVLLVCVGYALLGRIAMGKPRIVPMFAIFIFAAAYDLSAALTELPVAIRLSAMAAVATRIAPTQITIISTAAMDSLFPRWVIFVRSTHSRRSRHVRFASIASEPSHRSESTLSVLDAVVAARNRTNSTGLV